MREEEGGVLLRLGAAIEVAVEEGENAAGRLEEFVAVLLRALPCAGHQPGYAGFAVDEFFAGEAVGADGGVERGHEQRCGDSLAADVADGDADAGLFAADCAIVGFFVKDEEVVVVAADGACGAADAVELELTSRRVKRGRDWPGPPGRWRARSGGAPSPAAPGAVVGASRSCR